MRWNDPRKSGNVEDKRGFPGKAVGGGIGGIVLLIIVLVMNATGNGSVLNGGGNGTGTGSILDQNSQLTPEEE